MKKIIFFIVACSLFIYGCGANENVESKIDSSEVTGRANAPTTNPTKANIKIEEDNLSEYNDFGSNEYWKETFKKQKDDIEFVVNWFKNIDYCESLSFYEGEPMTLPDNDRTIKRIKEERDYEKIKKIILENKYDISNDWYIEQSITLLHRFDIKGLSGNYCLIYVGDKMEKSEEQKKYYKKVDGNYYSKVIFYE